MHLKITKGISSVGEAIALIKAAASRQPKALWIGGIASFLAVAWVLYVPPLQAIGKVSSQWRQLRSEVFQIRQTFNQFRQEAIPTLPSSGTLPEILEGLNALARTHQVQVLELTPGVPHPEDPPQLVALPIQLKVEGGYRNLGELLGELTRVPDLGKIRVRSLSLGREERLLPSLRADLSLEIFLSEIPDA